VLISNRLLRDNLKFLHKSLRRRSIKIIGFSKLFNAPTYPNIGEIETDGWCSLKAVFLERRSDWHISTGNVYHSKFATIRFRSFENVAFSLIEKGEDTGK
jgi:hypothetical protein